MAGIPRRLVVLAAAALAAAGLGSTAPVSAAVRQASRPSAATATQAAGLAVAGLAVDALTSTWQAQSDLGSTGSPQPLPTTTADCGDWSGADGTQVVGLNNGEDLWSFGDTYLGPAVARQALFNSGFIRNSMVVQSGSALTTVTGGSGCAAGQPTTATAPITSSDGNVIWPASSIAYGSDVEKFYYTVNSAMVQQTPQVVEIPQADLESANTYSAQASALSGCVSGNPIMWGAATVASGGYTYLYGSQQYSGTGGDVGGQGGRLYLARTTGDPSQQAGWTYYTTSGWSAQGAACGSLTLAALGGGQPIEVPTEFSVTIVNGDFWLVDQDPANGDLPGWAVAHEATAPTGFSDDPGAAVDLFEPTQTTFSGIDDSVPGLTHYAVRMLEPSAVTPSQSGAVVIAYNVNDGDVDPGCVSINDYDANAYRPRFVDVPISDLVTSGSATSSAPRGTTGTTAGPGSRAAASTSWTYDPDTVPSGTTWSSSCPVGYAAVDPNIAFSQNPDGSVEVSWPNQGADAWYCFHWQDDTSYPGVWNENEYWTQGPNADGYLVAPPTGAAASTSAVIYQVFTLPAETKSGDTFSFWVQAFAAGNGGIVSPDSSASARSYTPSSPGETASGLTATAGTNAVTLTWNAVPPGPPRRGHPADLDE